MIRSREQRCFEPGICQLNRIKEEENNCKFSVMRFNDSTNNHRNAIELNHEHVEISVYLWICNLTKYRSIFPTMTVCVVISFGFPVFVCNISSLFGLFQEAIIHSAGVLGSQVRSQVASEEMGVK